MKVKNLDLIFLTVLLTYLGFFVSGIFHIPLYRILLEEPLKTTDSIFYSYILERIEYPDVYWDDPRDDKKGLITHKPEKSFDGLTFFSSSKDQDAYLVDMNGNIVHQWSLSYKDIWPDPQHIALEVPEHRRIVSRAHLFPNGDILAIYTGIGSTPLGYGLAKVDKDSKLIWAYDDAIHHDAEVAGDGTIYTLSHHIRSEPYPGLHKSKAAPPLFEDFLVILSPDGKLIKEVSFLDLFANSPTHKGIIPLLRRDPTGGDTPAGDMLHPNDLEIVPAHVSQKYSFMKQGQILVSFRNLSMIALIDPDQEIITWSLYLPTRFQHDPRFLDDGTIVLFDNFGHAGPEGSSRVVRIDPSNASVLWQYTGTKEQPLYSAYHSSVDPLPNRNILVTESLAGRLLEVTPGGEVVWDYRSPWRGQLEDGSERVPAFYRGRRYQSEDLTFLKN